MDVHLQAELHGVCKVLELRFNLLTSGSEL